MKISDNFAKNNIFGITEKNDHGEFSIHALQACAALT